LVLLAGMATLLLVSSATEPLLLATLMLTCVMLTATLLSTSLLRPGLRCG
jgi:hypothetical protein